MDENNMMNNENEELNEVQETEAVEETVDAAVEETTEDVVEELEETVDFEEAAEYEEDFSEEDEVVEEKKEVNYKTLAIIGFALAAVLLLFNIFGAINIHNHKGYINTNGYTIGDVAKGMNMNFLKFKWKHGLPLTMKKDTYADAAKYMISVGKIAKINGTDFETLKNAYGFSDKIKKGTKWGKALDSVKLSTYLDIEMKEYSGEAGLEEFKKKYELGEEVTGDTTWGEVRRAIQAKEQKKNLEPMSKVYFSVKGFNKYNNMGYLDTTGGTIDDVVAASGMKLPEFLEMYGLPADMTGDTYLNAAQSLIVLKNMAELNGMDFEEFKSMYKFGDDITEESTWGEAVESMSLRDYVGEGNFDTFKSEYGFGDEVTLDTKWGEIRQKVEEIQVNERLAQETASMIEDADTAEEIPEADVEEGSEEVAE